jgi:hypothetical protein
VVIGAKGGENVVHKDRTRRGRKMLFTKKDSKRGDLVKEGDQLKL